jgi:death on curing protein
MTSLVYLTLDQAVDLHRRTVKISGGGAQGHIDIGKLGSVLEHIQNDNYYPSFSSKLTHLFFCACKYHCFQDGNKRIAIVLCSQMLLVNGYLRSIDSFIRKAENISYHVAAGRIGKELLGEWIDAILNGMEDDESLKLKILEAISSNDL